jgi:hypothetical protein
MTERTNEEKEKLKFQEELSISVKKVNACEKVGTRVNVLVAKQLIFHLFVACYVNVCRT